MPLDVSAAAASVLFVAVVTACPSARAHSDGARQRAITLYNTGKNLMEADNYAPACPMLAESLALEPQVGTMLNLAYCYEHLSRTASAWSMWLRGADAARAKGDAERESFARYRASLLEPNLLRVNVDVAPQVARERIEVSIDGGPFARSRWGQPTPFDPGEYVILAQADGLQPWSTRFLVDEMHLPSVIVPVLLVLPVPAPVAGSAPPSAPARSDGGGGRGVSNVMPVVWGTAALGVVGLGMGAGFGVSAIFNQSVSYDDHNCVSNVCNAAGAADRWRARHDAQIASVSFALGGGAILTSFAVWLFRGRGGTADGGGSAGLSSASVVVSAAGGWSAAVHGAW